MAIITESKNLTNILAKELAALENIHRQNPDTGADTDGTKTYLGQYTNHLFGSPFQLIDSVDKRFDSVNSNLGSEYMRNFTLNAPILHIKPGMSKYTGGGNGSAIANTLRRLYTKDESMSGADVLLEELAKSTIFRSGSKLQRRMFGFQDTYYQYMSHVNYMCRSMAAFLCLVPAEQLAKRGTQTLPYGTFTNKSTTQIETFDKIDWSNYRFLSSSKPMTPSEELGKMAESTVIGSAAKKAVNAVKNWINGSSSNDITMVSGKTVSTSMREKLFGTVNEGEGDVATDNVLAQLKSMITASDDSNKEMLSAITKDVEFTDADKQDGGNVNDIIVDKINSVMFMVEPVQFEETITNTIEPSYIESMMDSANQGIGQELAFITNSNVDFGTIDGLTDFLGTGISAIAESVTGIVEKVSGGFLSNLLHGAVRSIKGQKMIYPDIYKSSNTDMNYNFTVNLVSPYGDDYNYYMNIVVPLVHLICLAAPRAVTSNAISSPFLVQAWIPGSCTCQLGMISNFTITKNPNLRHMSVHGFPLEVKVTFTIRELYNSLSISPANDPASFLFNETLNDYMANLGGLAPSSDTYNIQRKVAFEALEHYVSSGEYMQDALQGMVSSIEAFVNPFISSGQ